MAEVSLAKEPLDVAVGGGARMRVLRREGFLWPSPSAFSLWH